MYQRGEYETERHHTAFVAIRLGAAATLTYETLNPHDRLIGLFFNMRSTSNERQFAAEGKAVNDKVRPYAKVGAALIAAKEAGDDPFRAIKAIVPWEARTTVKLAQHRQGMGLKAARYNRPSRRRDAENRFVPNSSPPSGMLPNEPRIPVWRPVIFLSIIFDLFGGQLEEAQALHYKLALCHAHPRVLDDATLVRIRQVYCEQREFLPVQREQFTRWQSEISTPESEKCSRT
ncbi:hypothetical protein [Burkholderia cenocepacia]|uniref:hypothetical protein n=1 Tax=Burkholderia cenocepacia TaxID=95486 RepID=UPI000AFB4367|nr:hypothetical protein [Burkholderia cenocepacia]